MGRFFHDSLPNSDPSSLSYLFPPGLLLIFYCRETDRKGKGGEYKDPFKSRHVKTDPSLGS